MNSECRKYLQKHIQVKLEREPETTPTEMKEWLLSGQQMFDLTLVKSTTLFSYISRNMDKFTNTGTMGRKVGSGGGNKISKQTVTKVKRLSLNKKRRSLRRVAAMVGICKSTVKKIFKQKF